MQEALTVRLEALASKYDDEDEPAPAPAAVDYALDFPCAPAAAAKTSVASAPPKKAAAEARRATPAETAASQVSVHRRVVRGPSGSQGDVATISTSRHV
jgi:hypothetical protein